jgi:hypothetical protein
MSLTEWSGPAWSPAWWSFWTGIVAAVLAVLTAIAGVGAFAARQIAARESSERAQRLELRVAEQQERAAKAERDLLELRERQKDRQFTDEQYLRLVASLARAEPKVRVQITFIDQSEPKRFAELLLEVFERAGWPAEIIKWNRAGMLSPGVNIESRHGDTNANTAARLVGQQVVNVGTPAFTGENPDATFPANTILIRIGPRPR